MKKGSPIKVVFRKSSTLIHLQPDTTSRKTQYLCFCDFLRRLDMVSRNKTCRICAARLEANLTLKETRIDPTICKLKFNSCHSSFCPRACSLLQALELKPLLCFEQTSVAQPASFHKRRMEEGSLVRAVVGNVHQNVLREANLLSHSGAFE